MRSRTAGHDDVHDPAAEIYTQPLNRVNGVTWSSPQTAWSSEFMVILWVVGHAIHGTMMISGFGSIQVLTERLTPETTPMLSRSV